MNKRGRLGSWVVLTSALFGLGLVTLTRGELRNPPLNSASPIYAQELPTTAVSSVASLTVTLGITLTPGIVPATVTHVTDGDTIEVSLNGQVQRVRYIGIDTPETEQADQGVDLYGPEAAERNQRLCDGQTVYLEKDVSETDKYGRNWKRI